MKKRFRKLSIILIASLIFSSVSGSVFAEPYSGEMDEALLATQVPEGTEGGEAPAEEAPVLGAQEEGSGEGSSGEEEPQEEQQSEQSEQPEEHTEQQEEEQTEQQEEQQSEQQEQQQEEQQSEQPEEQSEPQTEQQEEQQNRQAEETVQQDRQTAQNEQQTAQPEQQTAQSEVQTAEQADGQIIEDGGTVDTNSGLPAENSESGNEIVGQAENNALLAAGDNEIQEEALEGVSENNMEVASLSGNAAEESLSENTVPEVGLELTLSENEVLGNSIAVIEEDEDEDPEKKVSENKAEDSLSDNEADEESGEGSQYSGGNIDMFMDFGSDTVEEISESSDARLAELASSGEAELSSIASEQSRYLGSYDEYFDKSISYVLKDASGNDSTSDNKLCWAYTAAALADINMTKKGLRKKGDKTSADPLQIAQATYNQYRYDSYGETWKKTSDTPYFDKDSLSEKKKSGSNVFNHYWDYTGIFDRDRYDTHSDSPDSVSNNGFPVMKVTDERFVNSASGNLLFATFNYERWASPYMKGEEGGNNVIDDEDVINYEADTSGVGAQLKNAYWVPSTDIDAIKAMIVDHGAVGIQMRRTANGKNGQISGFKPAATEDKETNQYEYIPLYNGYKADHTVALVGWDDSVAIGNFKKWTIGDRKNIQPARTGAFLAVSSTVAKPGEGNDYLGYDHFWISYEDAAFKAYNNKYRYAVAYDFVKNDTSDYSYGYDGSNYFNSYSTKKVYGIFKSGHSGKTNSGNVEVLKSVGVGIQDSGRYRLTIYSGYDPSGDRYLNQFEVLTQQVELSYPGYHTIELDEPILFYKNDMVSVCFERVDATDFHMLVDGFYDKDRAGYSSKNSESDRMLGCSIASENGVIFSSYTNGTRTGAESFFMSVSGNNKPIQGSAIPYNDSTSRYMGITPRMRLYTSDLKVPGNIDQTMLDIKLKKYIWTHTGKAITPIPEVLVDFNMTPAGIQKDRGGKEYPEALVMYNKIGGVESHYNYVGVNNKDEGIAAVIVRGKGDIFSGEISVPFKIVKDQLNISKCKIEGLEPQEYSEGEGKALTRIYDDIKNNMIVKYYVSETKHYVTLTEGIDYTVGSIEGNNVKGKKLTVMVTGIGTFKNTVKPKFKLQKAKDKKPISDRSISVNLKFEDRERTVEWNEEDHIGDLPEINYTGKKIKPEVVSIYDAETGKKLEPGIDYNVKIKYKKNKNAGMAQIIIKAAKGGPYSGKVTRYFMIKPTHVTTDAVVKFQKSSYKYTGKPIKAIPKVTLYGKKLKKGNMYVDYSNNTGSSSGTATAQGIVFGKGRYTGYMGYGNFTITAGTTTKTSSTSSSSSTTSSSSTK